jgi:hypothetical protein
MTTWRVLHADRRVDFCPIALDLRDEFTGDGILVPAAFTLEVQHGAVWIARPSRPVRGQSGTYLFTGLGRSADPAALPQFRVRVTVSAPGYRPLYRLTDDALEFDIGAYNDQAPPAISPIMPQQVLMLPSAGYRYAGHIRTLKGRVLDLGGDPVADAEVSADGVERVMTDESGGFAVPLRWQDPAAVVAVSVQHPRSGLGAAANFNLPADLVGNHDLTIS